MKSNPRDDNPEDVRLVEADGDDLVAQLKGGRLATLSVGRKVDRVERRVAWSRILEVTLGVALVLALAALFTGGEALRNVTAQANRNTLQAECIRQWAVATTQRAAVLTDGRADLDDITSGILFDALNPGTRTRAENRALVLRDGAKLSRAKLAYDELKKQHPIPPAPTFTC